MESVDIEAAELENTALISGKSDEKWHRSKLNWIVAFLIGLVIGGLVTNLDRMISAIKSKSDSNATSNNLNELDALNKQVDDLCIQRAVGGCSVAAYLDGELVYDYGSGYVDVSNSSLSIMRIASISKSISATAVCILMDTNELDIHFNSSIFDVIRHNASILELFESFETLQKYMHNISIHHLLTHTAGFRHYEQLDEYLWTPPDRTQNDTRSVLQQYLSIFGNDSLEFEPGTGYKYSSFGYSILSILVEVMTNVPFYDYVQRTVFDEIGLTETGTMLSLPPPYKTQYTRKCDDIDRGYKTLVSCDLNDSYSTSYYDEAVYYKKSAGGFMSTAADVAKFGVNVAWNQNGLLLDETYRDMFIGHVQVSSNDYYGYGWHLDQTPNANIIWHSGGAIGGISYLKIFKDAKLVVAVICDTQYGGGLISTMTDLVKNYFVQ